MFFNFPFFIVKFLFINFFYFYFLINFKYYWHCVYCKPTYYRHLHTISISQQVITHENDLWLILYYVNCKVYNKIHTLFNENESSHIVNLWIIIFLAKQNIISASRNSSKKKLSFIIFVFRLYKLFLGFWFEPIHQFSIKYDHMNIDYVYCLY